MVERSRRKKEAEMDEKTSHMVFATAALAAVAAVLAGPAGAQIPEGTGGQPVTAQSDERQAQSSGNVVVPYLSQGMGVDKTQFSGTASRKLAAQAASQQGVDVAIKTAITARSQERSQLEQQTIPYLSQGVGVDESQFAGTVSQKVGGVHAALTLNRHEKTSVAPLPHGIQVVLSPSSEPQSLGLTGDSPLARVSAPEPEGLTGDSALTRVPGNTPTPTFSGGEDFDWTSFGAGAGMVALVAAGLVGILLTARRRHTIGLP
ncbi:MAG TPA: hypothetical protein VFG75_10990 [Gaiella sp.]|nr:hypothetical protein [Gaiella sp.]